MIQQVITWDMTLPLSDRMGTEILIYNTHVKYGEEVRKTIILQSQRLRCVIVKSDCETPIPTAETANLDTRKKSFPEIHKPLFK